MKKMKNFIIAGLFALFVAAPTLAITNPVSQPVSAADCENYILGVPPWYRGLTNGNCEIISPTDPSLGGSTEQQRLQSFIWRIVLNIIQIGLVLAAYIAFFFVLYGGFLYITGGSNPSQVEKARKSIFNAIIGLVIALGAVAVTNFIFGNLVGNVGSVGSGAVTGVAQLQGSQLLQRILNVVYFLAGTIAVIVIIIAGLMYVTASGDSGRVTKSKNTLTYAIVGLVIVILAFAITNFVLDRFA
jgi:type IV secretory pathway VirB2 component (pilin)